MGLQSDTALRGEKCEEVRDDMWGGEKLGEGVQRACWLAWELWGALVCYRNSQYRNKN